MYGEFGERLIAMKESTIREWREHVVELMRNKITENGKFPHRSGSTGFAMRIDAINRIFGLAIKASRVESRTGKRAEALAAEKLRELADRIAPPKKAD